MKYKDLFIDFDDTLYDTHGNSMIALKKLFDERHWEKIMPSYEAFRDAYFATNVDVWAKYAHGEIDRDTLIVERYRRPVTEMVKACGGDTVEEKIARLITALREMNDKLNIPQCIAHYGADSYPCAQGFVPEDVFLA